MKVTESGKNSTLEVPTELKAGLAEISFENPGKRPHSAQLVRVEGDHTPEEVQKVLDSEGGPIPEWLRGAGGVSTVPPGKSKTVTEVLEPGVYYVQDDEGDEGPKTPLVQVSVTGKSAGELPSTSAKVVAKDYAFEPTGLKAGKNTITFEVALPLNKGASERRQGAPPHRHDGQAHRPAPGGLPKR